MVCQRVAPSAKSAALEGGFIAFILEGDELADDLLRAGHGFAAGLGGCLLCLGRGGLAGRIGRKLYATASSPLDGLVN